MNGALLVGFDGALETVVALVQSISEIALREDCPPSVANDLRGVITDARVRIEDARVRFEEVVA